MKKVMFVCTGNICRSPLAEGVLRHLSKEIEVASSGLQSYHVGEMPDYRAVQVAEENNIDITKIRATKFTADDFAKYDYIFAMAPAHLELLSKFCPPEFKHKLHLFLEYTETINPWENEVKDPYYGTAHDFREVYFYILEGCQNLIPKIFPKIFL